ncbi:MAG TPA: ROK family protein [Armatimonadota bacterium]|nr:ROK family protein [Armatimonadota bacterium]
MSGSCCGIAPDQLYVGLDVGGTGLKGLLCTGAGEVKARASSPTEAAQGYEAVMSRILDLTEGLVAQASQPVAGIGLALAGNLRSAQGTCVFSPNLPGWRDVPVAGPILERFPTRFRMGNDANCAALAEHRFGAGRGTTHMAMLTLGTGVGGGLIIDRRLQVGPREGMAEIGHMIVDPNGPECGCGNHGCLEAFCGAAGISRVARRMLQTGRPSMMLDLAQGDILNVTPLVVATAASQGDALACEVLATIGNVLGTGLTSICMLVDPDKIILGGQIAQAGEPLLEPARRTIRARARMVPFDPQNVVLAQLGGEAGSLGAVALFDDEGIPELTP